MCSAAFLPAGFADPNCWDESKCWVCVYCVMLLSWVYRAILDENQLRRRDLSAAVLFNMDNRSQMLTLLLPEEEASRELCEVFWFYNVINPGASPVFICAELSTSPSEGFFSSEFVVDMLVFVEQSVLN